MVVSSVDDRVGSCRLLVLLDTADNACILDRQKIAVYNVYRVDICICIDSFDSYQIFTMKLDIFIWGRVDGCFFWSYLGGCPGAGEGECWNSELINA